MSVKNDLEAAVTVEVKHRKNEAGPQPRNLRTMLGRLVDFGNQRRHEDCWCELCGSDTIALSLNTLPTHYCTRDNYALRKGRSISRDVERAVCESMERVRRRPKHNSIGWVYDASLIRIINFPLQIGSALIQPITKRLGISCRCDLCVSDILAYALNRFPPKYGVELRGEINLPSHMKDFMRHDLMPVIAEAAKIISTRPRHSQEALSYHQDLSINEC